MQIFLVKHEYLRSSQLCEDQGIREKLTKRVCNHVLAILTTYMETRLYTGEIIVASMVWDCYDYIETRLKRKKTKFSARLKNRKILFDSNQ